LSTGTEGLRQPASAGFPAADRTPTLPPGRTTEQAIRVGVLAAVAGAIERLSADYPRQVGHDPSADPPTVVVSGGDGPLISDHLKIPHVQIPHLVCRGLLDLALKRCRSTAGGLK
jgi:pantothenate kinase type III